MKRSLVYLSSGVSLGVLGVYYGQKVDTSKSKKGDNFAEANMKETSFPGSFMPKVFSTGLGDDPCGFEYQMADAPTIVNSFKRVTTTKFKHAPKYDHVASYDTHIVSFDYKTRTPRWVYEYVIPQNLGVTTAPGPQQGTLYANDPNVPVRFGVGNADYAHCSEHTLAKGHLADPLRHTITAQGYQHTFYYTNIVPQVEEFKTGVWRTLQKHVWDLAVSGRYKRVHLLTIPLFLPKMEESGLAFVDYTALGHSKVAVPTHIAQIIVLEYRTKGRRILAYKMQNVKGLPHDPDHPETSLDRYRLHDLSEIERESGLLFANREGPC